jgi:hypothetical protein
LRLSKLAAHVQNQEGGMIKVTKDGRTILTGTHYTALREQVYERNQHTCEGEQCNRYLMFWEMELHHVYGRGMGGSKRDDVPEKVQGLCRDCHDKAKIKRREPVCQ